MRRALRAPAQRGFTLVEIMIVVSIISVLAAVAVPNMLEARKTAQERSGLQTMDEIYGAQVAYHTKNGRYASNLDTLVAAGLLRSPFRVGGGTIQKKGNWEFMTGIPSPGTAQPNPTPSGWKPPGAAANNATRFRVGMAPVGANMNERLKNGNQIYMKLENKFLYTYRYNVTYGQYLMIWPDWYFGYVFPSTEGAQ